MILFIVLILLLFSIYILEKKNPKKQIEYKNIIHTDIVNDDITDYKKFYKPKRYLITMNELNFYNVLLEIAKELDLILFSQVSLYNILETKPDLDYSTKQTYFNRIASKSIDFVLVDKKDCRIRICIELDDNTHKQKKRIERDKFINELFKSLEINLLRYPVYQNYYKDTLKRRIQENLTEHYYVD